MTPDETSSRNWFIPGHRKRSDRTPNWSGERPEVGRLPKAKVRRDRTWCMHTAILPMTHSCARRGARAWPTLYTTGGNASVTCRGQVQGKGRGGGTQGEEGRWRARAGQVGRHHETVRPQQRREIVPRVLGSGLAQSGRCATSCPIPRRCCACRGTGVYAASLAQGQAWLSA